MVGKVAICLLVLNPWFTASRFDGFPVPGQLRGTTYKLLQQEAEQVFLSPKGFFTIIEKQWLLLRNCATQAIVFVRGLTSYGFRFWHWSHLLLWLLVGKFDLAKFGSTWLFYSHCSDLYFLPTLWHFFSIQGTSVNAPVSPRQPSAVAKNVSFFFF